MVKYTLDPCSPTSPSGRVSGSVKLSFDEQTQAQGYLDTQSTIVDGKTGDQSHNEADGDTSVGSRLSGKSLIAKVNANQKHGYQELMLGLHSVLQKRSR
jgi:hypothetical protein